MRHKQVFAYTFLLVRSRPLSWSVGVLLLVHSNRSVPRMVSMAVVGFLSIRLSFDNLGNYNTVVGHIFVTPQQSSGVSIILAAAA